MAELALASRAAPFSAANWLYELKYDGFRLLASKDGTTVALRYRSGRVATALFPEVAEAVAALPVNRVLLDGELVVLGEDGRSDFSLLSRRAFATSRMKYARPLAKACLFDILALEGRDLRSLPLVTRKQLLRDVITRDGRLMYAEHVEGRGEQLFDGARQLGLEGVVAKRCDSRYVAGRSPAWLKFKIEETADFVVIGIAEPSRATYERPALVLAMVEPGGLRCVGRVAVGATDLSALNRVAGELRRASAPCEGAGRAAVWLSPAVVCEVRFLASSGHALRHAVFVRYRLDKAWRECAAPRSCM